MVIIFSFLRKELIGQLATQEQPLEANVSKSNTKESHNGSSGGSSPSEAQQQQQQPHRKRRATAEDLSQEQLPFTRVPAIARYVIAGICIVRTVI